MSCIPKFVANELKNLINNGKFDIDELASLSTADRRKAIKEVFDASPTNIKDADAIITNFNKGFEERIITSSRDWDAKIARQKEIIAENASKASVTRAKTTLEDLEGTREKVVARQKTLLKSYVEKEVNRVPTRTKKNIVEKIDSISHIIDPAEKKLLLEDLVSQKLGFGVSEQTKETLFKLAEEARIARETFNQTFDTESARLIDVYKSKPEYKTALAEAESIADTGVRKMAIDAIELDAQKFADDVFLGIKSIDGGKVSKEDFIKINKPRIENMMKNQALLDYVGAQDKLIGRVKWSDVKGAEGAYYKAQKLNSLFWQSTFDTAGALKSVVASIDLSFIFRQGWLVALNNPVLYKKAVMKTLYESWTVLRTAKRVVDESATGADAVAQKMFLRNLDDEMMVMLNAEISSRPNARRGLYQLSSNNFGLNVGRDEAFPSAAPTRLPIVGRFFKASDYFFNALAQRTRADMADMLIYKLQKQGVELDKKTMDTLGEFVSSSTGRGKPFATKALEGNPQLTNAMNVLFFSPRFVGSRIETITNIPRWMLDKDDPVKKIAARYTAQATLETIAILSILGATTKMFYGDKGGFDGTIGSSSFGYLKMGDYAYDFTGGHGSILSLVGKIVNTGKGVRYDNKLGVYVDTTFGENGVDVLTDWITGKTAPATTVVKDLINQHRFGGEELSTKETLKSLLTPLTVQNVLEATDAGYEDALLVLLAEGVGLSSKEMRIKPNNKEWKALKSEDPEAYDEAVTRLNENLFPEVERLRKDSAFQKMTREEQDEVIEKSASRIKKSVLP